MDADPDLQLVRCCQSGDISAFDALVHRHKDRIYRLVYRILGDSDEMDDTAQEIFLRAYRKIGRFRYQSSFSTWLTQIAVNYCVNCLRRQRSFRFFPMDTSLWGVEPQAEVECSEKFDKVHNAINSLPPKQKAVIILHYFEDHPCEEIADILNCSIGTVKSRLFNARKELKRRLELYITFDVKFKRNQRP